VEACAISIQTFGAYFLFFFLSFFLSFFFF